MNGEASLLYGLLLSLVAGTPLVGVCICCLPGRAKPGKLLAPAALPALAAVFFVPVDVVVEVPWFFMGGRMGLDETGRIFLCVSAFIWFLAAISAGGLGREKEQQRRFAGFFLAAMCGNFGLILARDMLGYYLFFALMSFAAYGLVVHDANRAALKAGRVYLAYVMIGEIALFLALVMLGQNVQSTAIEDIGAAPVDPLTLVLLFIGFGVKIGAMPLQGWMRFAYQAAPVPAAAALAGAMVNAGLLGWLRFLPLGSVASPLGSMIFIFAGAVAVFYGVAVGLGRKKAGEILAFSSISQMGLMTVIFGLGLTGLQAGQQAASVLVLYAVHHSLAKSCLFLGCRGMSPRFISALYLPAFALAGLPFTSGAAAKIGFKDLAAGLEGPWQNLSAVFLPMSSVGTTLLVLHFMRIVQQPGETEAGGDKKAMFVMVMSLFAVALVFWLWPATVPTALHSLQPVKIWQALWPVLLGCLLFFLWQKIAVWHESRVAGCDTALVADRHDSVEPDNAFQSFLERIEEKNWQSAGDRPLSVYFSGVDLQLRKAEKILGRWVVVGLTFLLLSIILYFLA